MKLHVLLRIASLLNNIALRRRGYVCTRQHTTQVPHEIAGLRSNSRAGRSSEILNFDGTPQFPRKSEIAFSGAVESAPEDNNSRHEAVANVDPEAESDADNYRDGYETETVGWRRNKTVHKYEEKGEEMCT